MTRVKDLQREWMKKPGYRDEYEALEEDLQLVRSLIEARSRAGLSQTELARRMKTSQSYVARIEGGQVRPSTAALTRFAEATGSRLKIIFEPAKARGAVSERKALASRPAAFKTASRAAKNRVVAQRNRAKS